MVKKSSVQRFLILILFSFCFISCSKKKTVENFNRTPLNEMIFQLVRHSVSGKCSIKNADILFYPEEMNRFLLRKCFTKEGIRLRIENDFPDYAGVIEVSGLYFSELDSGSWVEDAVLLAEEERIADEINELDNMFTTLSFEEENRAEEIEKLLTDVIEEKIYTDKDSRLSLLEYGSEILIPVITDKYKIIIKGDEKEISRYFYDDFYRLVKKELWSIEEDDIELKDSEEYEFSTEERKPASKIVELNDTRERTQYDGKGNLIKSEKYFVYEGKEYLIYVFDCEYDKDNRIVMEEKQESVYDETYSKVLESFNKKYVYVYHDDYEEDIPADFEYYEDDVLKMVNRYSNKNGTYTSQIFFDQILSVQTYYENNKKVKDVYLMNNIVKRVKNYEQK